MIPVLTLNLGQARPTLSPFEAEPLEFPDGQRFYKAESASTGGGEFGHHRYFRCAVYAQDCLPTENGYESVHVRETPHTLYEDFPGCKAAWLSPCDGEREALLLYDPAVLRGVTTTVFGSLLIDSEGTCTRVTSTTECEDSYTACEVELKGIETDAPCIRGVVRVKGHTILYTSAQLFYNGAEDLLDYTPSVRSTAGSFAVASDIGAIQTIVPFDKGMYILGDRGGVYGECSGDLHFPFTFVDISNFPGIPYADAAQAHYNPSGLIVMAHNGLMVLKGSNAESLYPDFSRFLLDGRYSELNNPCETNELGCNTQVVSKLAPFPPVVWDPCEFRDTYDCCGYTPLYTEYNVLEGCKDAQHVAVHNISARYTTISYASNRHADDEVGINEDCIDCGADEYQEKYNWADVENYRTECNECGDGYDARCYCYNRLLVIDHYVQRVSVLHVSHTDVIRGRHNDKQEFIIIAEGKAWGVRMGLGIARLYFHEFEHSENRIMRITNVDMRGRFDTGAYNAAISGTGELELTTIATAQGVDRLHSWVHHPWHLTEVGSRQIQYAGLARCKNLSFILPFVGRLVSVGLAVSA